MVDIYFYVEEERPTPVPYKFGVLMLINPLSIYRWTIKGEGANSIFTVNDAGELFVTKSLDREEKSIYNLTNILYDENNRRIKDEEHLYVCVLDINDNIPIFPKVFSGSIMERSRRGTEVVQVTATDADDPNTVNGELRYTLTQAGDHSAFQIDSITGIITSRLDSPDRQTRSQYMVVVQAQDMRGMATGHTATTSVTITITDNNDNIAPNTQKVYELQVPEDQELNEKIGSLELVDRDEIQKRDLMLKQAVFSKPAYSFSVLEEMMVDNIGLVTAIDPDKENRSIRYSIQNKSCPIGIDPITGQLFTLRKLEATHRFQVKAQEEPSGLESLVNVTISVQDINHNEPKLDADEIYVCENDMAGTVIGTVRAIDKDLLPFFRFYLTKPSAIFSIVDSRDNTADIKVRQGKFSLDDPRKYSLEVGIDDGGRPPKRSVTHLPIKVCRCDASRVPTQCKGPSPRIGVSFNTLITILLGTLAILTIFLIVILIVMGRPCMENLLASMKNSEGDEQLVTYTVEGGGELDTDCYDVSILIAASQGRSMPADPNQDGCPCTAPHVYSYEGPGSITGSLSPLISSSTESPVDCNFLNSQGPRFKTVAEVYSVHGPDC
ncbi:cadherin-5-like [Genypterus blacodes]|uniref:cadherin-5-like n=1 Tax=Genypterus blacodes TaxID=154954 RepID=UPI003F761202